MWLCAGLDDEMKTLKSRLRIDVWGWTLALVAEKQSWEIRAENFCYRRRPRISWPRLRSGHADSLAPELLGHSRNLTNSLISLRATEFTLGSGT